MKCFVLFLLACIFFASCGGKIPKDIIQRDAMIALLVDVQLAEANTFAFLQDSIKLRHQSDLIRKGVYSKQQVDSLQKQIAHLRQQADDFYAWVYKKHHTNNAQFKKSLNYYSKNLELFEEMYVKVSTDLEEKIKQTKPEK